MKGRRNRGILFIFWILLAVLATSWIFFIIFTNSNLILTETIYQFVLVICLVSMMISALSLHDILSNVKLEIKEDNEKQNIVREYYNYNQLLDPPTMNN